MCWKLLPGCRGGGLNQSCVWHLVKQTGHHRHDIPQLHPVCCNEEMERDGRQLALWPLAHWTKKKHCWLRDGAALGQTVLGQAQAKCSCVGQRISLTSGPLHHVTDPTGRLPRCADRKKCGFVTSYYLYWLIDYHFSSKVLNIRVQKPHFRFYQKQGTSFNANPSSINTNSAGKKIILNSFTNPVDIKLWKFLCHI